MGRRRLSFSAHTVRQVSLFWWIRVDTYPFLAVFCRVLHDFFSFFPQMIHSKKRLIIINKKMLICGLFAAVKECFFEDEIRCILIKKTKNGKKARNMNIFTFGISKEINSYKIEKI